MTVYTIIAVVILLIVATMGVQWWFGSRKIGFLKDIEVKLKDELFVSIIFAACNEEESVEKTIESIEKLNYENFELIVVNDRSSDKTGDILENLQDKYSNLKVIHIEKLPKGWLGKNHALYEGVKISKGDWLLFTDADIIFSQDSLSKAMSYVSINHLDHLASIFESIGGSTPLRIYHSYWSIATIWLITVQKFIGVGAFNLIKKSVYNEIGTHKAISLRPDDDFKLGKLVVKKGFKQGVLFGNESVRVKWYGTLKGIIKGFEKNAFATVDYNLVLVFMTSTITSIMHIYPFVGIFLGDPTSKVINLLSLLILFLMYKHNKKYFGNPSWYFFLNPISATVSNYILLRATFKNLIEGQISWRGTKYSLKLLKKNKI